jgi:outer membrane lipoprotein LolB
MAALLDARAFWPAAVAMLSLLAACATVVAPPDRSFAGRFAATATRGEQRESVSGRFNLEVRGHRQTLDLATPLGTTLARIDVEPGQARATGAQMQELRGPDADDLTEQLLGWRLPVGGLADWLEGRPAPGRVARIERDAGRVVLIEQDGWTIRLSEASDPGARPRRLLFERPAGPGTPAVSLRLILDEPAG